IPEYKNAQTELDNVSGEWEKEISLKYNEINLLDKAFEAEKSFLSEEMIKSRKSEMNAKFKEVRELQNQKFGINGELFKKRKELIKPLENKICTAIFTIKILNLLYNIN
ncbi:MAG: OmpH family outer membrane protein, partial [Bacteroidia bacterium]|nr:OmpH family outer membrane protein [Bacteroidia bacterium]